MFNCGNPNFTFGSAMLDECVVCFRSARSPNDIERRTMQKFSHSLTCFGQGSVRAGAKAVGAGGIAWVAFARLKPRLARCRAERRSGVMVEINHCPKNTNGMLEMPVLKEHSLREEARSLAFR